MPQASTASSTRSSTPSTTRARPRSSPRPAARAAVTIATNMAGRGTDIILGGNPEFMAWADLKRANDEDGRPLYPTRLEVPQRGLAASGRQVRAGDEGRGPRGRRARRPAHHRHRAAREPPDRQPASRPVGPPGRPRIVAVLPLARRRPDAEVRRRLGLGRPHPPRHGGGRGHREQDGQPPDRRGTEEGRGAQLRHPQEPARIRRGHGRAAEAGLLVPPDACSTASPAKDASWT